MLWGIGVPRCPTTLAGDVVQGHTSHADPLCTLCFSATVCARKNAYLEFASMCFGNHVSLSVDICQNKLVCLWCRNDSLSMGPGKGHIQKSTCSIFYNSNHFKDSWKDPVLTAYSLVWPIHSSGFQSLSLLSIPISRHVGKKHDDKEQYVQSEWNGHIVRSYTVIYSIWKFAPSGHCKSRQTCRNGLP